MRAPKAGSSARFPDSSSKFPRKRTLPLKSTAEIRRNLHEREKPSASYRNLTHFVSNILSLRACTCCLIHRPIAGNPSSLIRFRWVSLLCSICFEIWWRQGFVWIDLMWEIWMHCFSLEAIDSVMIDLENVKGKFFMGHLDFHFRCSNLYPGQKI